MTPSRRTKKRTSGAVCRVSTSMLARNGRPSRRIIPRLFIMDTDLTNIISKPTCTILCTRVRMLQPAATISLVMCSRPVILSNYNQPHLAHTQNFNPQVVGQSNQQQPAARPQYPVQPQAPANAPGHAPVQATPQATGQNTAPTPAPGYGTPANGRPAADRSDLSPAPIRRPIIYRSHQHRWRSLQDRLPTPYLSNPPSRMVSRLP